MATRASNTGPDARAVADRWIADYCGDRPRADVLCTAGPSARPAWHAAFTELAGLGPLAETRDRVGRHAADIGTGYRVAGARPDRPWPLSPVPLMIPADEWAGIADGVVQRACLLERIVADIYGPGRLVAGGYLPAGLVTGNAAFWRPMAGLAPPGGHHLHFLALDLVRAPDGRWHVLSDAVRTPVGAGYALENRLALSRSLGGLTARLNVERHAPFFAAFRDGLGAVCRRAEPRIGLLSPGRWSSSYAEQAHLARYLGFLLVEGADLAVRDDRLYVRTIVGLKRIDALWRRVGTRWLDPLAFDSSSQLGVAGLVDAVAAGNVVVASAPGVGVVESAAMAAYLPALSIRLTGEGLRLPGVGSWWCGEPGAAAEVRDNLDRMVIAPAFADPPLGLPGGRATLGAALSAAERAALLADLDRRPQDYVGQEVVRLSTMPVVADDGTLVPRPFALRVFAARGAGGGWTVLPGGFARIGEHLDERAAVLGEGTWSADVIVHGPDPVAPTTLLPRDDAVALRRNPGTLPSRAADNLYWLGRYLERGEALLTAIRALLGHSIGADSGGARAPDTLGRLAGLIAAAGTAPPSSMRRGDLAAFARAALDADAPSSVRGLIAQAAAIGDVSRDRLAADMLVLLDAPHPSRGGVLERAGTLQRRFMALAGLSAEHMGRTDGWRFHDLGRRVERAAGIAAAIRAMTPPGATADDLATLLDLADSQISYRQRYLTGIARAAVVDLVALDPGNPRGLAYQVGAIGAHLAALPVLGDDGLAEPQQAEAAALAAGLATLRAADVDGEAVARVERRLATLSVAVARRYFLQGPEPLRAAGFTLA